MSRFVLLDHDHPEPHWDLMLERDGVLWTWRLRNLPDESRPFSGERIGDHRLHYLDYEGPVSGDRGRVLRVDRGELQWITVDPIHFRAELQGKVYCGTLEGTSGADGSWTLIYRPA